MTIHINPASPPFPAAIQNRLDALKRGGTRPLVLFTTLANDPRLFERFMAGSLLDRGNLTIRQREIIIDRVTARCGSEYEWGVHIAFFAERAALTAAQITSIVHGDHGDACWTEPSERLIIRLCDELDATCQISDRLGQELALEFPANALLEMLMLCGFYRMVSYLTNATGLPLEAYGARFPVKI